MTAVLERREGARPSELTPVVPLFTRHMLGAIEAERDLRRRFHKTHPRARRRLEGVGHPRIAAALAANARLVTQARLDESRWVDEGGRFDPVAAARLRNGHTSPAAARLRPAGRMPGRRMG